MFLLFSCVSNSLGNAALECLGKLMNAFSQQLESVSMLTVPLGGITKHSTRIQHFTRGVKHQGGSGEVVLLLSYHLLRSYTLEKQHVVTFYFQYFHYYYLFICVYSVELIMGTCRKFILCFVACSDLSFCGCD